MQLGLLLVLQKMAKKCKQCGKEFKQYYSTLQQHCSVKCAVEWNKPEEIERRFKQIKEDARSLSFYEKNARASFQIFIRMRDKNLPCISCGTKEAKQWDGGHYLKAELYTGLIFNEINCNKQCSYCNDYLSGNLIKYRQGLLEKYGVEKIRNLENKADESRVYKFTKFELLNIRKHYQQKIKLL